MAKKDTQKNNEKRKTEIEKVEPTRRLSPFDEMDRMFESFFPHRWMQPFHWEQQRWPDLPEINAPKVDVIDRDKEIVVKAEMPGVDKKDVDVSMTDNNVTIKGSTSHEEKEEKGNYYRCEISRGSFSRTVSLPANVDAEKAKATFNNGILELVIPKVERSHRKSVNID